MLKESVQYLTSEVIISFTTQMRRVQRQDSNKNFDTSQNPPENALGRLYR